MRSSIPEAIWKKLRNRSLIILVTCFKPDHRKWFFRELRYELLDLSRSQLTLPISFSSRSRVHAYWFSLWRENHISAFMKIQGWKNFFEKLRSKSTKLPQPLMDWKIFELKQYLVRKHKTKLDFHIFYRFNERRCLILPQVNPLFKNFCQKIGSIEYIILVRRQIKKMRIDQN